MSDHVIDGDTLGTEFQLWVYAAIDITPGIGGGFIRFLVRDREQGYCALYYGGYGGWGLGLDAGGSMGEQGPPTDFTTNEPARVTDFHGAIGVVSMGAGIASPDGSVGNSFGSFLLGHRLFNRDEGRAERALRAIISLPAMNPIGAVHEHRRLKYISVDSLGGAGLGFGRWYGGATCVASGEAENPSDFEAQRLRERVLGDG